MKIKYLFVFLISSFVLIPNIFASSISYNLNIDKDLVFHENNVYKINKNEMITDSYDFMTDIVNNKVYFDTNTGVKYSKTKSLSSDGTYTIRLKHNYSSMFLSDNRILSECFSKTDIVDTGSRLSIKLSGPFYCYGRADTISVNVTTDLDVVSANATSVNGNKYTWIPNEKTSIRFVAKMPVIEEEPMDEDYDDRQTDISNKEKEEPNEEETEVSSEQKTMYKFIIVVVIIFVVGFIALGIATLKNKKNNLNKI